MKNRTSVNLAAAAVIFVGTLAISIAITSLIGMPELIPYMMVGYNLPILLTVGYLRKLTNENRNVNVYFTSTTSGVEKLINGDVVPSILVVAPTSKASFDHARYRCTNDALTTIKINVPFNTLQSSVASAKIKVDGEIIVSTFMGMHLALQIPGKYVKDNPLLVGAVTPDNDDTLLWPFKAIALETKYISDKFRAKFSSKLVDEV